MGRHYFRAPRQRNRKPKKPIWTSFELATVTEEEQDRLRLSPQEKEIIGNTVYFLNSIYQVALREIRTDENKLIVTHLSIRRIDKQPIFDWRDIQRIKNEILGEEIEAMQIFPAESRKVDEANQFHLWALPPGKKFDFGFPERRVSEESVGNSKQRPFDKGQK